MYTLGQLADMLNLECRGDSSLEIKALATLASAGEGQLSFFANPRYLEDLRNTGASAVIVAEKYSSDCPGSALLSPNPYLSFAAASAFFAGSSNSVPGIHSSCSVAATAQISPSASIAANVVIGEGVIIGANTRIGAGSVIGDSSTIGANCLLHGNVTIYHGITLGDQVILHSGSVIGSDGFGYAPSSQEDRAAGKAWLKIHQLGAVKIGNNVEIGANSVVDRGALDDTVIGNGVIIDNLVQIAHNVVIGDNTAIAGCTGIAGSSKIGRDCTIAGRVSILGHLNIADGTHLTTNTVVSKSITETGSYSSGSGFEKTRSWRKNAARFSRLDEMYRRLLALEKKQK